MSEYRNDYANCLPFEDVSGAPYLAIAYLGRGDEGKVNKDVYKTKIFESLGEDKISQIKSYEYEGNDWFLVVAKYKDLVTLKKENETVCQAAYGGEAFVVRCNQDLVVNVFDSVDVNYKLSVDETGILADTGEDVWDITNIDEILKP